MDDIRPEPADRPDKLQMEGAACHRLVPGRACRPPLGKPAEAVGTQHRAAALDQPEGEVGMVESRPADGATEIDLQHAQTSVRGRNRMILNGERPRRSKVESVGVNLTIQS